MIIEYNDGSREGIELGIVYGKAEGAVYPHPIVSNVKENQTFKKDDVLAYNSNFFEQDILDPSSIIYKTNFYVKTALYESDQTFEDSSSISKNIANKLKTTITKTKEIVVSFDQNIVDVVNVGDNINVNQPYMTIEDPITSTIGNFSEDSLKALSKLSSQTPKSNYDGVVTKIEVLYNGDKNNMSEGLKKLADKSDRLLSKKLKSTGKDILTGKIDSDYRVNGSPLLENTAVIIIYLDVEDIAGVGDKGVFANQLKSVFGEVMDYDMTTETGIKIDAVFGYRSIAARIVLSPIIIGTTITLLNVIAKKSIEIYKGGS